MVILVAARRLKDFDVLLRSVLSSQRFNTHFRLPRFRCVRNSHRTSLCLLKVTYFSTPVRRVLGVGQPKICVYTRKLLMGCWVLSLRLFSELRSSKVERANVGPTTPTYFDPGPKIPTYIPDSPLLRCLRHLLLVSFSPTSNSSFFPFSSLLWVQSQSRWTRRTPKPPGWVLACLESRPPRPDPAGVRASGALRRTHVLPQRFVGSLSVSRSQSLPRPETPTDFP